MGSICSSQNDATAHNQNGRQVCSKPIDEQPSADYLEQVVCDENEIKENQMRTFDLGEEGKCLVVKQDGIISAVGHKCTHYGALLHTGALGVGRVRCPWHGACFNILTGDIEDFPGQDSIPCFKVKVEDGKVKVRAKKSDLESYKRLKDMVKRDPNNEQTFVVIGGGPSGAICVETLRQEGFSGRVIMVCREEQLPYDRVKVSKTMDFNITDAEFRTRDFYEEYDIEAMTGVEATAVDSAHKTVTLSNGYIIKYDKLYIATGCKPRKINVPGADLPEVVTMRDYADSQHVISMLDKDKHVVCLGMSFIALESAAYCANKAGKVTVIGRDTVPLRHSFGPEVGARVMKLLEDNNIEFITQNNITKCIDTDGKLTSVELSDGTELKCDICIMGTGSTFYTDFLKNSGIHMNKDGSIDTNEYLQTNVEDVYVGGDIANSPVYIIGQEKATIGHYPLAQYHGRVAAKNMVGEMTALKAVPYFWTTLFGKSFRYSGYGSPAKVIVDGDLEQLKFIAYHIDAKGNVIGMASCMRDPIVSQFAEFKAIGKNLTEKDLEEDEPLAWVQEIRKC